MINNLIFLGPIIASFLITLFMIPQWIKRAHKADLVGKDLHKPYHVNVAEGGGVAVLTGFIIGTFIYIAINTFIFKQQIHITETFALTSVILIAGFIGIIDDLMGWKIGLGRRVRIVLLFFAAIPLVVINAGSSEISLPLIGELQLGLFYPLIIIPLAVSGVSTTFNFIAGYNGLESSQSILILSALTLATWFTGQTWLTIITLCMITSTLALLIFNWSPAKVLPGDALTYSVGALIASVAILGNIEKFAIFIFIPNIIEVFLKLRGKLKKQSYGLPQKDGTLIPRYDKIYGLEHFALFSLIKFKGTARETEVVSFINAIQIVFIILGFIIFQNGIFI